jgi:hypothetical protein
MTDDFNAGMLSGICIAFLLRLLIDLAILWRVKTRRRR